MKLRHLLFVSVLVLLPVRDLLSQNMPISDIDETIQNIKENFQTLEKKEKNDAAHVHSCFYFKEEELSCVSVLEKGKVDKIVYWYFINKHLLYTETNWLDAITQEILYTEKTYHTQHGSLTAWLNSDSSFVESSSGEFKKKDAELRKNAATLLLEASEL